MKNFDIENLERRNVYKTPEGFLDQLQGNVLQKIGPFSQDIENLERKNIYATPTGFFDEVQQNVMQQVTPSIGKRSGKLVRMNWMYAAAASITVFFGLIYFVNTDQNEGTSIIGNETAIANIENTASGSAVQENRPQKEAAVAYEVLKQDMKTVPDEKPEMPAKPTKIASQDHAGLAAQKPAMADQNPEFQVDQILSDFSMSELATVGRNAEQDLYLDLYN